MRRRLHKYYERLTSNNKVPLTSSLCTPQVFLFTFLLSLPRHEKNEKTIEGNQLSCLPSSIGHLEALETLEIGDNSIRYLPESIGRLKRLAILIASNNGLTSLPETLGGWTCVKLLDFSRNEIARVPDGLARLRNLTSLDVRENKLRDIPPLPKSDSLAQVGLDMG